jgi:hypothetical protein
MPEEAPRALDRGPSGWQAAIEKLGASWCASMHDSPMWPIHGHYECRACGRRFPVPWTHHFPLPTTALRIGAESPRNRPARLRLLRSTLPPLLILLVILLPQRVRAADAPLPQSAALAAAALERYAASPEMAGPWSLETVEIDASLPKLEKSGRLRAIRRLLPFGKPQYQVLEITGDRTVRQQVIVRYLSAEMQAAAIPASSTAITPANYKFRYKRSLSGDAPAYIFLISPKKKSEGLIKGELWLDGATGAALRVSGRLVKSPSIFVKRIDVTRNTALRDGIAEMQVTHLSVDVRFIGRAELTVHERPCAAADCGSTPSAGGQ